MMGLFLCPLLSVSLCLMVGHSPREGGMGPVHRVMPGTDVVFRSADRTTVLGVGSIPGPMSCGWGRGCRRKQGGAEGGWAQEACLAQSVRRSFYHVAIQSSLTIPPSELRRHSPQSHSVRSQCIIYCPPLDWVSR